MSEEQQINNQQTLNQQQALDKKQNVSQIPVEKTPIFYQAIDMQWYMLPQQIGYFTGLQHMIAELYQTINQKWTQQQVSCYLKFLVDLNNYISDVVMTMQIFYFEDFLQAMVHYGQNMNSVGYQLYQKQLQYLVKLSVGYDFKLDKKKNKKNPGEAKPEVKKREVVEKQQKVVIRQGDPEINIQKLLTTQWDETKYIKTTTLLKQTVNLVFIGHVDSGKSTLTGNIVKELKQVDEQQILRNRQDAKDNKMEAYQQAGYSDIIPQERQDGKTRQFAKLSFSLQKKRFTLFDAPGHKNYVPNMIMGACQADVAVLIISAKEGEFESGFQKDGQSKQHAMLAKALGVVQLIVAVTKMGVVDWNQKRYDHIKSQVAPFLQNSCGFHNVVFIPIESIGNTNIHKRIEDSWWKGPCLTEYLDNLTLPERKPLGPLRIPVIDKFKDQGQLYIYGKLQSGTILEDQTVTLLPDRKQFVVREIFNAKDERLPFASAGENVKIRVKGIEENQIHRGDMVCNNLNYCQQSSEFKAQLTILELPDKKKILSSGYQCIMHMHAISEQVEVSKLEARIDKQTKKKIAATFLKAGEVGIAVIKLEKPVCLEKYDFMHGLGRFTLRDEGKTIGYGEVIGIKPAKVLLKEQKEQLLGQKKTEQKKIEEEVKNLSLQETKKQ